jgi:hypothetical protein
VKVDVTGPPAAVVAVLNTLTDPERPTPIGSTTFKRAGQSKDGLVRAEFKVYSVRVTPDATLGLEAEGAE